MKKKPQIRREYPAAALSRTSLHANPFRQFNRWFERSIKSRVDQPNAMVLSTRDASGQPHARMVLMKDHTNAGFVFFTNYRSRKAWDIAANSKASILFYWYKFDWQVQIEGRVKKISRKESEQYFKTRPHGTQIGAWASPQSAVLKDRTALERLYRMYEKTFRGRDVPCPPWWGGYILVPQRFEFWQGRKNRLHDRFEYVKRNARWRIQRLAP